MAVKWEALWVPFIWRFLPREMRARIAYTQHLSTDLFISLPVMTKHTLISQAQRVLGFPTFIETGTFLGDMSWHASHMFSQVHTIELDTELAKRASVRFAAVANVTVHQGDS